MASPRWIDNDHDFEDCCRELRAAGRVAVDALKIIIEQDRAKK